VEEKQTIVKAKMGGEYKEDKYLSNNNDSQLFTPFLI